MLLLFGPVTLPCGTFLFILLSEGSVQLSDYNHHQIDNPPSLSIHTGMVHLCCSNDTTSRISPLAASATFAQKRMRRIGACSLHSKGRVNGATGLQPNEQLMARGFEELHVSELQKDLSTCATKGTLTLGPVAPFHTSTFVLPPQSPAGRHSQCFGHNWAWAWLPLVHTWLYWLFCGLFLLCKSVYYAWLYLMSTLHTLACFHAWKSKKLTLISTWAEMVPWVMPHLQCLGVTRSKQQPTTGIYLF